jgi:hypothetical protein
MEGGKEGWKEGGDGRKAARVTTEGRKEGRMD